MNTENYFLHVYLTQDNIERQQDIISSLQNKTIYYDTDTFLRNVQKKTNSIILTDYHTFTNHFKNIQQKIADYEINLLIDKNTLSLNQILELNKNKNINLIDINSGNIIEEIEQNLSDNDEFSLQDVHFSNIIHELRSPLNSVLGYTSLLIENESDKSKIENLKIIKNSGKYMLALINDILDYNKLKAGKISILDINFILKNTLTHIYNLFELQAAEKNIDFILILNENLPLIVKGDEIRFTQIIINILSNALKFTDNNGKVTINSSFVDNMITINIEDTGIGMTDEQITKIFKPFEQATNDTFKKYGGSGLGVSISAELTKLLGGTITVDSQIGKGTSFTVRIPLEVIKDREIDDDILKNKTLTLVESWVKNLGHNQKLKKIAIQAIHNLPQRIEILTKALEQIRLEGQTEENTFELKMQIHKLKGFTGSYQMKELYEFFCSMDAIAKSINLQENTDEDLTEKIKQIEFIFKDIKEIIDAIPTDFFIDSENERSDYCKIDFNNNITVYYLDDLKENTDLFATLMETLKIKCYTFNKYDELIEQLNNKTPDLLFLDLQMPEVDGFTALSEIRQTNNSLYCVALTADNTQHNLEMINNSTFNNYIIKPYDINNIKNLINKAFKK